MALSASPLSSPPSSADLPRRKGRARRRNAEAPDPHRLPGHKDKAVVLGDQSKAFERVAHAWISQ
eukprot:16432910-Heterocapsa_arctica.AAC.1